MLFFQRFSITVICEKEPFLAIDLTGYFVSPLQISTKITEIQELRSKNLKLKQSLGEAMDKFEMIFGEKVDLENFAEALQVSVLCIHSEIFM